MKYAQTDTPIQAYPLRLRFNECLSIVIGRDFRTYESLPNQIQYLFRPTMSLQNSPYPQWSLVSCQPKLCTQPADAAMHLQKYILFLKLRKILRKKINNRNSTTDFEGVCLICRLWGQLSLQVGEINAKKFAMGRNMA